MKFLVTVDRDCRDIFLIDSRTGGCAVAVTLAQLLPSEVDRRLSPDAKAWNRGLKTIFASGDGYVVCDIFGIYRLSGDFRVERYLSLPEFTDLHSAVPVGDALLISNTGADEILLVGWDGVIRERIALHRWFPATPRMAENLEAVRVREGGDRRLMPLDWSRESCHANWAEPTPLGVMVSCFIQGEILFFNDGEPVRRVNALRKIHAPVYLKESDTILFAASEDDAIVECDLEGREVRRMEGFQFPKSAVGLACGGVAVADTNARRVVGTDPRKNEIMWECAIPGTPYHVLPVSGDDE